MERQEIKDWQLTAKELKEMAKTLKIKGWYRMRKAELINAIDSVARQEPTKPPKAEPKRCPHGKNKYSYKECLGSRICEHDKQRYFCKECGGNAYCRHWNNK